MHLNSRLLFERYGAPYFKNNLRVLEIGPSSFPSPYQKVASNDTIVWDTIDFVHTDFIDAAAVSNLTYELKSPYTFPIESETYDIILSGQVLEHVEKIWVWIKELKRILKPGGKIVTINPVSWPYHEAPIDCWRVFPSGIGALAEENGLKVELVKFESAEAELLLKKDDKIIVLPGRSYGHIYSEQMLQFIIKWNKFIRKIPKLKSVCQVPVEAAYDTISILCK